MSAENKTNVGIIGLGYWGKNILRNLCELGLVHTACDTSAAIIQERKKDFPNLQYTMNFDEMLQNSEINATKNNPRARA